MSKYFYYNDKKYYCESVDLSSLANNFGTPIYIYSKSGIIRNIKEYQENLSTVNAQIYYSVKALSNTAILKIMHEYNCGFDVVSIGEISRVLKVNSKNPKIIFSGVGKSIEELEYAINNNIELICIESISEVEKIINITSKNHKKINVGIRINPNVDPETNPLISTGKEEHKFGVDIKTAKIIINKLSDNKYIFVTTISCHIGSQITKFEPYKNTIKVILSFIKELKKDNFSIKRISLGGGLGINYENEAEQINIKTFCLQVSKLIKNEIVQLIIEPGRSIVGSNGVLLTKIIDIKENNNKKYLILDASMNCLMRPALYNSFHKIIPCKLKNENFPEVKYDVVGKICETTDTFAYQREIQEQQENNFLIIKDTGAYGMSMANNYNSRLKPSEVLIENDKIYLISKKEDFSNTHSNECFLELI
jgi:diaminopimelate decarboxylase